MKVWYRCSWDYYGKVYPNEFTSSKWLNFLLNEHFKHFPGGNRVSVGIFYEQTGKTWRHLKFKLTVLTVFDAVSAYVFGVHVEKSE